MERGLIKDYLEHTGMEAARSQILGPFATRDDVPVPGARIDAKLEALESRLTWRIIEVGTSLATVMTRLDVFMD